MQTRWAFPTSQLLSSLGSSGNQMPTRSRLPPQRSLILPVAWVKFTPNWSKQLWPDHSWCKYHQRRSPSHLADTEIKQSAPQPDKLWQRHLQLKTIVILPSLYWIWIRFQPLGYCLGPEESLGITTWIAIFRYREVAQNLFSARSSGSNCGIGKAHFGDSNGRSYSKK